jgi:acetyl-CoA acetyltransferase
MMGEAGDYSIEDILNAPKISTPINELNTGRTGDGSVAVILATEDYIKEHKLSAAYITGIGQISDAYYPTYRNFSRLLGAEKAAQSAYKMAGITPDKIQLAEVHESYAHQELMIYEALGFCKEGEATKLLKDGTTNRDGKLPVNPSGGVTCGNIIYASGLARVMEASLQVQRKAGDVQVNGVKTAVAHAQAGLGMQANLVMVLEA